VRRCRPLAGGAAGFAAAVRRDRGGCGVGSGSCGNVVPFRGVVIGGRVFATTTTAAATAAVACFGAVLAHRAPLPAIANAVCSGGRRKLGLGPAAGAGVEMQAGLGGAAEAGIGEQRERVRGREEDAAGCGQVGGAQPQLLQPRQPPQELPNVPASLPPPRAIIGKGRPEQVQS
jgi:hypothetical protein